MDNLCNSKEAKVITGIFRLIVQDEVVESEPVLGDDV